MSPKQYLVLFVLFLIYINLGAFMFFSIERPMEEERRKLEKNEALEIRELLRRHYAKGVPEAHLELFSKLEGYCGKSLSLHTIPNTNSSNTLSTLRDEDDDDDDDPEEYEKPFLWTYYNSLLFVICTLSTIGYGNLAPTTRHGRVLDVVYGLFGIPFMGIVLTQMADYFGKVFLRAHHRYRSHEYQTRLSLFFDILTYTGLGMVIFIFFPAAIFVYFEDWTFDTGVYYAFVTLTTIGYGDLVAGSQLDSWVSDPYRFMVLVWIMFGLGYMLMIVGFLTRAMKSKKVRKLEHKLAHTIKQTQSKIWNEFSHDVTVLRRMLNEMYLLKIQPVYIEKENDDDGVRRVKSCPNLTEWPVLRKTDTSNESSEEDDEEMAANFRKIAMRRRKANAENVMAPRIKKTVSDSDLARIDRKATFGDDSSSVDPPLLLAKVVDALGISIGSKFSLGEREEKSRRASAKLNGIQLFSDEEILASERPPSRWSLGGRKRAISEQRDLERMGFTDLEVSKTWTAANSTDIEKFMQIRANGELKRSNIAFDTKSISSMSSKSSKSDAEMRVPMSRMRRMSSAVVQLFSQTGKSKSQEIKELRDSKKKRKTGSPAFMPTINRCKRLSLPSERHSTTTLEQSHYLSQITGRRGSVFAAIASELTPKDTELPVSPVLEHTSVADFLRLLTSLQARLDSTQSVPPGIFNVSEQNIDRRKSVGNLTSDTKQTPLSALFATPTSNGKQSNNHLNFHNLRQRRASIAKASNLLELNGKPGRRFSLIPPMDVDHPSGVINHKHVLQLRRQSKSSQNMTEGSTMSIPGLPLKGSRKSSISGTAKYISTKLQSSFDSQKIVLPNLASSFRKFSVRPVPQSDIQVSSQEEKSIIPVIQQCVPIITVEQFDGDCPSNKDDDSLKDVVISRL